MIRAVEYYPYARSVVESLAAKKHKVKVLFDERWSKESLWRLQTKAKVNFSWGRYESSRWRKIIFYAQDILSWRRYFKVRGQSSFYRDRYLNFLPGIIRIFVKVPIIRWFVLSGPMSAILAALVRWTPAESNVVSDIIDFSPDVIVGTPGNMPFSSCDQEYLRAAKFLKIPTAISVFSWDNLTTKGIFPVKPDLFLVWNETQVAEAKQHHGINRSAIKIIGAPLFDFWFDGRRDRQVEHSFYKKHHLDRSLPILLYLETSDSLTGDERWLVKKLRDALDGSDLKKVQMVVRPHPFKSYFGKFVYPGVSVIPKKGSWPESDSAIRLYRQTILASDVVFGINTSGLLDATILDKPSMSMVVDTYKQTQLETQHFGQMVKNDVLVLVESFDEFTREVRKLLAGQDLHKRQRGAFVKRFIRPRGLRVSAGESAAREIEKL